MTANYTIEDDWSHFPQYAGALAETGEFIVVDGGMSFRVSMRQVRQGVGLGWGNFSDSANWADNKLTVSSETRTLYTVDGLFSLTETRFIDGLTSAVWSGNKITPQAVGETYIARLTFQASKATSSTGSYLTVDLDVGFDDPIFAQYVLLIKASGATQNISVTIPIFCLETFFANGGSFYITPSEQLQVWNKSIFIQRISQP